jgi:two-component system sensor histidine kinase RegB
MHEEDTSLLNLLWLLRLRWVAIAGISLPLLPLAVILLAEVVTNLLLTAWARGVVLVPEWVPAGIMAMDVVLLTLLLSLTGGAFNPFSFLYLVHIALAAVVLRSHFTWALVGLALAGFGALFMLPEGSPAHSASGDAHADHLRRHLEGMWVAFGVAAGFIVYFVQRVRRALAERESELVAARNLTARNEKFASLATLAAGAAHELSTPLSTIAVVAKELERQLEHDGSSDAVADVRLIREQVTRCRDILHQMAADAGDAQGEGLADITVADLVSNALDGAAESSRIVVTLPDAARDERLHVPPRAVAQALRGVLNNAVQASGIAQPVTLRIVRTAEGWRFEVRDAGSGMSADVLRRAGEPFFTTKSPGRGMGLGLFLTRAVLSRLGGRLELDSTPGQGTAATLVLPAVRRQPAAAQLPSAA